MSGDVHRTALIGRRGEQRVLAELLDGVRQSRSGVLVIRGEAGIGKTALITHALAQGPELHTITISGAESEMELAYAGVQQLCAPLLGFLNRLPEPQRKALQVALGLREDPVGAPPDRLFVGLALMTLLGEAGSQRPVVCVVDDAQWVDSASLNALALVARRILADPVAIVFAARDQGVEHELAGLPEVELHGLDEADARTLLSAMVPGRIDERVRENILAESGGNPLALLELYKALKPAELAGGYGLAAATSRVSRIVSSFERRLRELPSQTMGLLLIAAAEPAGRAEWLWAAAELLGVDPSAAEPAEQAGLISVDKGIRFRHPLIRSAIYRGAAASERRRTHAALAESIDESAADDHRAWHRAHAAPRPDEQLATDLVRSSERASGRGGVAAAAAFLAYAAELTPDPSLRAQRRLDAASAKLDAGAPAAASELLVAAAADSDAEFVSARIALLEAKLAFAINRGRDAPPLLLIAAERLRHLDPLLASETYLEALMASLIVGRMATDHGSSAQAIARAAREAPATTGQRRAVDLLLSGLIVRLADGPVAATPLLTKALGEFLNEDAAGTADPRWHGISHRVSLDLFDWAASNRLAAHQLEQLRSAGELTVLPAVLYQSAGLRITAGRFDDAVALLEEAEVLIAATGAPPLSSIRSYLAAYRGQERLCRQLADSAVDQAKTRGEGAEVTVALYSKAILHNGLGQYPEALEACRSLDRFDDVGVSGYMLVELIEAATRCGHQQVAVDAFDRLHQRTSASPTETALGLADRSAALISGDSLSAEAQYRSAISHLESSARTQLARAHLVYGEWLRRVRRRRDARLQLRTAYDMFTEMGIDGFAERARRELKVAGETVHARSTSAAVVLTAQESHIARLARDGYTSAEIAGQLFLSPRTVEWHLGRIFIKLGVNSRRELRNVAFESSN